MIQNQNGYDVKSTTWHEGLGSWLMLNSHMKCFRGAGIERIILRLKYLPVNLEWLQYAALVYVALQKWSWEHILDSKRK